MSDGRSSQDVSVKSSNGRSARPDRELWAWYQPAATSLRQLARCSEHLFPGHRAFVAAGLLGGAPFALSFLLGLPGHQVVSAILLSFLMLALVRRDALVAGMACMVVAFASHSTLVILAAKYHPTRTASVVPDGASYWEKQIRWIRTGEDPEYQWQAWVPAHTQLALGSSLYSFTSMGALTFAQGFYEVDLMNYYNGRLASESRSTARSITLGWHVWSVLRGVGYLFLTFELISISFQTFSGVMISTNHRRLTRWVAGISFLLADGIIKWVYSESVRQMLDDNLLSQVFRAVAVKMVAGEC